MNVTPARQTSAAPVAVVAPSTPSDCFDIAVEATHRTVCRLLEVPDDQIDEVRTQMRKAMPVLSAVPTPEDFQACEEAHVYLRSRAAELIEMKRAGADAMPPPCSSTSSVIWMPAT